MSGLFNMAKEALGGGSNKDSNDQDEYSRDSSSTQQSRRGEGYSGDDGDESYERSGSGRQGGFGQQSSERYSGGDDSESYDRSGSGRQGGFGQQSSEGYSRDEDYSDEQSSGRSRREESGYGGGRGGQQYGDDVVGAQRGGFENRPQGGYTGDDDYVSGSGNVQQGRSEFGGKGGADDYDSALQEMRQHGRTGPGSGVEASLESDYAQGGLSGGREGSGGFVGQETERFGNRSGVPQRYGGQDDSDI